MHTKTSRHSKDCLTITNITKETTDKGDIIIKFHLDNGSKRSILWYQINSEFSECVCDDRCDSAVTSLLLAAMKFGYKSIKSDYPISEKLYYNFKYHFIPQICLIAKKNISRIKIDMPIINKNYTGSLVATGMSRGVDSFATMYEYGKEFELKGYQINTFTYFQAGAHHGYDPIIGRGSETKQELYENQMKITKEFCNKYGYPLIIVDSNIDSILRDPEMFREKAFDRTHTFRNLGIVMLLQKGISKYYYSSAYQLNQFNFRLNTDMAYWEKWIIPHLSTGSVEFYQSNQAWSRMDKVKMISNLEESYDYLQVCLIQTGNCGKCVKCKRTLIELDALGDKILDKYKKSFDIEKYKREDREKWFRDILVEKDQDTPEAHYYDDAFICAMKNNPQLIDSFVLSKEKNINAAILTRNNINIRELPSSKSNILFKGKKGDSFKYHGECGIWLCLETEDKTSVYVNKKFAELV